MSLKDPALSASGQIIAASKSSPSLRRGSKGPGVVILQAALIDLGYRMPVTLRRTGKPDGKYGSETRDVVAEFQKRNGIKPMDGIAGRNTIRQLDRRLVARTRPKVITSTFKPKTVEPEFVPGLQDPRVPLDPPRRHGRVKPTVRGWVIHTAVYAAVMDPGGPVGRQYGPDAAKSMRHFLLNSGARYQVRFRALVAENQNVREAYEEQINQVKAYVENLPPGTHTMVSKKARTLTATDTNNWALTVGGFNAWAKGKVFVREGREGRHYELHFTYKFKDRYNFDKGKGFSAISGLPFKLKRTEIPLSDGDLFIGGGDYLEVRDTLLARLHDEGYAKNFITYGAVNKLIRWKDGESMPRTAYNPRVT